MKHLTRSHQSNTRNTIGPVSVLSLAMNRNSHQKPHDQTETKVCDKHQELHNQGDLVNIDEQLAGTGAWISELDINLPSVTKESKCPDYQAKKKHTAHQNLQPTLGAITTGDSTWPRISLLDRYLGEHDRLEVPVQETFLRYQL
ncbi:hypothetical protein IFR05_011751 [Cadophora sp. M221]|nr:hypothetical protein IFR05_011751 [Cadophora sp. M221]